MCKSKTLDLLHVETASISECKVFAAFDNEIIRKSKDKTSNLGIRWFGGVDHSLPFPLIQFFSAFCGRPLHGIIAPYMTSIPSSPALLYASSSMCIATSISLSGFLPVSFS